MAIVCSQCNAENPDGFAFCGACGAKLQTQESRGGSAKHHLAVLVCDLVDSTPISERLGPEDYAELIQAYQSRVGRIVSDWGGYIAQYLGDGILVYFGYPVAAEDDTQRALSAGLAMVRATERLSNVYLQDHGVQLQVRVGIHTGVVVAANIGTGARADRLAIGQTPNIAARVQGVANPGEVWLSEAAHRSLRDTVKSSSMGNRTLKGIAEPIELFRAESDHSVSAPTEASVFVGREVEMQRLEDALTAGTPGLLYIHGEAGIGKSRVVRELQSRHQGSFDWYVGRCSDYHKHVDLHPFIELLKHEAGVREDESLSARIKAVDGWLARLALGAEDADLLRRMVGPDSTFKVESREVVFEALVHCFAAMPKNNASVLVLEDTHWADPSSLELLGLLVAKTGMFVLVTSREQPEMTLNIGLEVPLLALTMSEMDRLLNGLLQHELSEDLAAEIVSRSGGVPFFAEELVRAVTAAINKKGDSADGLGLLPDSVHNALHARIDALGAAKELVQVGSLLGRRFDLELLEAVLGHSNRLNDQLRVLIGSGLVQREALGDNTRLRFQHALVQDVAYRSLLKSQRVDWHKRIVAAIREQLPNIVEVEPQTMGRHLHGAEMFAEAVAAYQAAGAALRQRAAYDEAASVYRLALDILAKTPDEEKRDQLESRLLRLLISSLTAKGGYQSADTRPYLDRMTELSHRLNDPVAHYGALMAEWGFHTMIGHRTESEYYAQALLPYTESHHSYVVRSNVHYALGSNKFYLGDYLAADQHFDQGLDALIGNGYGESRKDLDQPAFLNYQSKGLLLCLLGDLDGCVSFFDTALDMAQRHGASFAEVQTLIHLGFVRREREDPLEQRLEELGRAVGLCQELKFQQWELAANRMAEWARFEGGESSLVDDCINHYARGNENTTVTLGYELAHSACVLVRNNLPDLAEVLIARARSLVDTSLGRFALPDVLRIEGVLAAKNGDMDLALSKLLEGIAVAKQFGGRTQELKLRLELKSNLSDVEAIQDDGLDTLLDGFSGQEARLASRAIAALAA